VFHIPFISSCCRKRFVRFYIFRPLDVVIVGELEYYNDTNGVLFDSCTVLFKCPQRKVRYTNPIRTRYRNWRTTSATQLQPSKSLCYIGYTATWLDVYSCVLMQEAIPFKIFYDGISFQHLATVLISVFRLCCGPGLLFRGPSCISVSGKHTYISIM